MSKDKKNNSKDNFLAAVIVGVLCLWVAGGYFPKQLWGAEEAAWLGDSFGAINALFSGLAFVGLVFTLLQQREELKLQREEMKQMREQYERSANAQEGSEEVLRQQTLATLLATQLSGYDSLTQLSTRSTSGGHKNEIEDLINKSKSLEKIIITNKASNENSPSDNLSKKL